MTLTGLWIAAALLGGRPVEPVTGWKSGGPALQHVSALAVAPDDDSLVYAGAFDFLAGSLLPASSLYRSDDGGRSWSVLSQAPAAEIIDFLAVDPADGSRLAAVTKEGGIARLYRSSDGGSTWAFVLDFQSGTSAIELFFEPTASGSIYVSWSGITVVVHPDGSWQSRVVPNRPAPTPPYFYTTEVVSLWPSSAGFLFFTAKLRGFGFFGRHEDDVLRGDFPLPDEVGPAPCLSMTPAADDPFDPSNVYATCDHVVRSRDFGSTWESLEDGPASPTSVVVDRSHGGVVFALDGSGAIFRTNDGGDSWARLPDAPYLPKEIALSVTGDILYAATDHGVFRHTIRSTREVDLRH